MNGLERLGQMESCIPAMTPTELLLILNGVWIPDCDDIARWGVAVARRQEEIHERIRQSLNK